MNLHVQRNLRSSLAENFSSCRSYPQRTDFAPGRAPEIRPDKGSWCAKPNLLILQGYETQDLRIASRLWTHNLDCRKEGELRSPPRSTRSFLLTNSYLPIPASNPST
jgi:hypothetical protein